MRIVNRDEFLNLPDKTVFCRYEPDILGPIEIKSQTLRNDGCRDDFVVEYLTMFRDSPDYGLQAGDVFKFDDDQEMRDAIFDQDGLYAVFDQEDILQVIGRLQQCLK